MKHLTVAIALVTFLHPATAQEVLPRVLPDRPQPNYDGPVPERVIGHVRVVDERGGRSGMAGISVTDGFSVVTTDDTGAYVLTPDSRAVFVYITRPAGYDVQGDWYKTLDPKVDFTLKAAAEDEASYFFINVSDTHTSTNPRSLEGLSEFVREVNALMPPPRFVINSGDLINLSKTLSDSPETGHAFFRNYAGIMNNLNMPHYNVAGDHTDSSYRLDAYPRGDIRCGKALYWEYLGPNFFSFEYGKIHFMSIDSAYHLGERTINGREYPTLEIQPMHTAWMRNDMSKRGDGTYVVTASETDLVEQCPGFLDMAAQHDVRMQLTGDIHVVSEKHHEVPYRTAGALSGCWWNPKCNQLCPDLRPQGYLIYHVDGEEMECFYKGLGQRVAITSPRIGAPLRGTVTIQAHVVQPKDGEKLQLSLDGDTWHIMEEQSRPFYRAVFGTTIDTVSLPDGFTELQIKSTPTGETRTRTFVIANGTAPADAVAEATLTFSTKAGSNRAAHPSTGAVEVRFNGAAIGTLKAGAEEAYTFPVPAKHIRKANVLTFEFEESADGMYIGSPVLTIDGNRIVDPRDAKVRAIKQAHWGPDAIDWGGYAVGDGNLVATPFVRQQDVFCFVLEPSA